MADIKKMYEKLKNCISKMMKSDWAEIDSVQRYRMGEACNKADMQFGMTSQLEKEERQKGSSNSGGYYTSWF